MKTRFFLAIAAVCLLCWTLPSSAQVPITVFPDPVQFGTIPLKSSGSTIVYLDNTTAAAAVISAISITGTNNADFSLLGTCVGTISAGQYCQLPVSFTPAALGARSASLQISVLGVTTAILIPLEGTGGNPGPTITSLSPASVYQNSAATTVTITGSGFLSTSLAYFGYGTPLATTFVSATELKAVVPASDLSSTGTYAIAVTNANGSTSSNFNIVGLDPIVQSVSPSSLVAGNAATSIILSGSNFQTGAKVLWNGTALTTTYLSSGQLQAQASAANLASAGIVELAVSNPAPGGLSSPVSLDVTYPVTMTILDLPANDLVWDPFAQLIYASLPSSYGVNGNSIAVINPTTGVVTAYHYAGSEPTKLALSADGKYLYVGLNGDGSVQRMVLPNFTLDINVSLGTTGSGIYTAADLKVSPTDTHTIAVALAPSGCCGTESVVFFTDSTKLANSISSVSVSDLEFASGTTLYGYYSGELNKITVSATGGTIAQTWSGLVYGADIQYAAGLIYGDQGLADYRRICRPR